MLRVLGMSASWRLPRAPCMSEYYRDTTVNILGPAGRFCLLFMASTSLEAVPPRLSRVTA